MELATRFLYIILSIAAATTTHLASSSFAIHKKINPALGNRADTTNYFVTTTCRRRSSSSSSSRQGMKMSLVSATVQVNDIIQNNKVVLFGVSDEPQTRRIKFLFDDANVQYCSVDVDLVENGTDIMKALEKACGKSTVPLFFIDGRFIGDHESILQMNLGGYLGEILEDVGALPTFSIDEYKRVWSAPKQTGMADPEAGII